MDKILKSSPESWNSYFKLLKKIDQLVKNNLMYKNYLKIYPSPELQIEWLSPKKKVLWQAYCRTFSSLVLPEKHLFITVDFAFFFYLHTWPW